MDTMAAKKKTTSNTKKKGRVQPNVTKAGFKPGHRYGCGGKIKN